MTERSTPDPATATAIDGSDTVPGAGPALPATTIERYRIERLLGAGGMGVVYAAYDPELERRVALKVLPDPATGRESRERLLREARAMARLAHPNVVTVYEVGSADGRDYVAMELVDGVSLAEWLRDAKPRPREIVAAFVAAGRGLAAAHASGIVHRDFKPRNVLCRRDGRVHVTDFGLAVSVDRDEDEPRPRNTPSTLAGLTETGAVLGTPAYMAPEQWDGDPAGPAADQFAFCVALWEALAGARPYRGNAAELRVAMAQGPAELDAANVPRGLRAALRRGLESDPDRRWPSMDALLARIARWQRGRVLPLALGGAGAAALALAAGAIALGTKTAPPCAYDASLLVGRWDDVRRAALRATLADPNRQPKIDAVIAALDQRGLAIADSLRDTCRKQRDEEISEPEERMTGSCLARRAFELGAVVSQYFASKPSVVNIANGVQALATPGDCAVVVAHPLAADPAPAIALYDRFAELVTIPHPTSASAAAAAARDVATGEALERDAIAANELELAARAAFAIGMFEQRRSRADAADAAMQRAHRIAVDVRNANIAARALVERSRIASRLRGDARAAFNFAELAVELANKPSTMPRTRATAYAALGGAQRDRGDLTAAAASLRKALDALPHDALAEPYTELDIRFALITVLGGLDGQQQQAVALARDTIDLVRRSFGEHHGEYAIALNMLGSALGAADNAAAALPYRRQALAVQIEVDGPDTVRTTWQRLDLAGALVDADEPAEAKPQIAIVMARVEHDASLRGNKPAAFTTAGRVAFETGDYDEGVRLLDEAVEANIELGGSNTTSTEEARARAIAAQLELGHAGDAERRIATLEHSYRTHPDDSAEPLANLDGLKAEVARLRGQQQRAAALARAALAAAEERHAPARVRASLSYRLALCLADARRYADARSIIEQTRQLGAESSTSVRERALVDAVAADVEAGVGHRDAAVTLAERARPVLARFPGEIQANKRLRALLARLRPMR